MKYEDALQEMLRGSAIARNSRTFRLRRGVEEVTQPGNPERYVFSEDDRAADDWEIVAPTPVAEAVESAASEASP